MEQGVLSKINESTESGLTFLAEPEDLSGKLAGIMLSGQIEGAGFKNRGLDRIGTQEQADFAQKV